MTLENLNIQRTSRLVSERPLLSRLEILRKQFAKAYEKWTPEEESLLGKSFQEGTDVADLARLLQRQPGAIESRLRRLGLIQ